MEFAREVEPEEEEASSNSSSSLQLAGNELVPALVEAEGEEEVEEACKDEEEGGRMC